MVDRNSQWSTNIQLGKNTLKFKKKIEVQFPFGRSSPASRQMRPQGAYCNTKMHPGEPRGSRRFETNNLEEHDF
jgi:hypothetical protein